MKNRGGQMNLLFLEAGLALEEKHGKPLYWRFVAEGIAPRRYSYCIYGKPQHAETFRHPLCAIPDADVDACKTTEELIALIETEIAIETVKRAGQ